MPSKIKIIIISAVIVIALVLAYIFFIKKSPEPTNLTSSSATVVPTNNGVVAPTATDTEFLSVLLSIKNIKLNNSIFSDKAFINLRDSSITLTPAGNEGRKNPFAPIGVEPTITPAPVVDTTVDTNPTIDKTNNTIEKTDVLKIPKKN